MLMKKKFLIPDLPLMTSEFRLSAGGNTLIGGPLVPIVIDPVPSILSYIPAKISLENLNNADISQNSMLVASANATFNINFLAAGQADSTGKTCSTFPSTVQTVFTAVATIWGNIIQSSIPIKVNACWSSFSGNTLGYAGAATYGRDFTNAPIANTWYPVALANSLAGSDLAPSLPDINATFNSSYSWYYGIDGNTPQNKYDLLTVVLHEMGHGLGFLGFVEYSTTTGQGAWGGQGFPIAYDRFVKDGSGNQMINTAVYPNPSITLGTFLRSGNVLFTGANAVSANNGSGVKLYAPSTWQSGSSYSHLDYNTFINTLNQLMIPSVSTGKAVHDPGVVTKGLFKDIGWQISGGGGSTVPSKATLVSPSGTVTDATPTYTWNAVSGSTWYHLWVNSSSGTKVKQWYTAGSAGCSSGSGTCSITPTTTLSNGSHTWWIRTNNSVGNGLWSSGKVFSVVGGGGVPSQATLVSPSGTITDTTPTYTWNAVSGSTWYYLWVNSSSGTKVKQWYTAGSAGCSSGVGTCSITPSTTLGSGSHTWWIRTYNSAGKGPWSSGKVFSITGGGGVPSQATLVSPSGAITDTSPTYTWNAVSGSTWYYLWVNSSSGTKVKQWYTAGSAGCSSGVGTCSITPSTTFGSGSHTWWIRTYNSAGKGPWSSGKAFSVTGQ